MVELVGEVLDDRGLSGSSFSNEEDGLVLNDARGDAFEETEGVHGLSKALGRLFDSRETLEGKRVIRRVAADVDATDGETEGSELEGWLVQIKVVLDAIVGELPGSSDDFHELQTNGRVGDESAEAIDGLEEDLLLELDRDLRAVDDVV